MSETPIASISRFGIHLARCWACMTMQCPGGAHDWANQEDIDHAAATAQPSPVGQVCGCACAAGPLLDPEPDEPDWVEVRYRDDPCDTCGEVGACAYDSEGRALIHVTEESDGEIA